jgi:hypothetical protein
MESYSREDSSAILATSKLSQVRNFAKKTIKISSFCPKLRNHLVSLAQSQTQLKNSPKSTTIGHHNPIKFNLNRETQSLVKDSFSEIK